MALRTGLARRLPFVPRLLPVLMVAMMALAGLKSAGLIRAALAESKPAESKPADPKPGASKPGASKPGASKPAESAPPTRPAPAAAAGAPPPVLSSEPAPQLITPPPAAASAAPPVSEAERAILLDLRRRRGELEGREAALASREGLLSAAEKRLSERAGELADLQKRLEALETARQARDEANWKGMVKVYETMKPREAAAIFNDLDRPVLLAVLDRMKEAKAALVLAAMSPERARQITAELAQRRLQANRPAEPAAPRAPGG
jgi:flagellar motility protein MotE (MotC chaperone)